MITRSIKQQTLGTEPARGALERVATLGWLGFEAAASGGSYV
jgi:hypothetical protein